ncbi:MAG: hypothetical protein MI723_13520, partial [Caulobacterales bacterium]|nr:hypothetical protein [Caulobacterales bacterium]
MTAPEAPARPAFAAAARWAAIGLGVVAALAIVLRLVVMSPLGGAVAERVLDGRALGGGLVLRAAGVRGDVLGAMRADRLSVSDAEGEWLVVEDARLAWSPWAIAGRRIAVRELSASQIAVARRPVLAASEAGPSERRGGAPRLSAWSVALDRLHVGAITLAEGVAGPPAALTLEADARVGLGAADGGRLVLARSDAAGDVLSLQAERDEAGRLVGAARLEAAR